MSGTKDTTKNLPVLFTVAEAAAFLGYRTHSIYRLIWRGKLSAVRVGTRAVRVREDALKSYIKAIEGAQPGAIEAHKRKHKGVKS